MGCIPAKVLRQVQKTLCDEKTNGHAIEYNKVLSEMLPKVQASLLGSKIVIGDAYKVLVDAVAFPAQYG